MIETMTIQELKRLKGQISRSRAKLKKAQGDLEAARARLRELELAHQEALQEFVERGYRDITNVVKPLYEQDGGYPFLCTLFSPDGIAIYCRDAQQRQEALLKACTMHHPGTAAYPQEPELWQVVGNFEE